VFPPFTAIPSGVVYLVKRTDAVALGGFSEDYPVASGEDIDLLFTFWTNDCEVVLDERVLVEHESAVTVAAKLGDRDELYRTNRLIFAEKWSKADPRIIPQLGSCSPTTFAANLEKARIAGTWMGQWFRTLDRALTAEARIRRMDAGRPPQGSPAPATVIGLKRRVPARIRRLVARLTNRS
jgi:hypothetical protein